MEEELSLREIKKRMTREAIAAAALKLTVEKGLANVTLDEIAREAFVSPRTVSNYFSAKEEAVLAAGNHGLSELIEEFDSEDSQTPPLAALWDILSSYAREHPENLQKAAQTADLERDNPSLRPFRVAQQAELEDVLRSRIAARTGTDAATDVYPWLVSSAVGAALSASLAIWSRRGFPEGELPRLLDEAFMIVTSGYPAVAIAEPRAAAAGATSASGGQTDHSTGIENSTPIENGTATTVGSPAQ
ncbi:TetR/AcrR family transcriptional regulator [Pseudactinotalea sp. Z1748]|uniref:TetR/AcrR family transcriptional regulator n=1 Tax=Pseudactinotalea sp. Z1748 TaxID=3413027 RepID=UPI003C7D66EC